MKRTLITHQQKLEDAEAKASAFRGFRSGMRSLFTRMSVRITSSAVIPIVIGIGFMFLVPRGLVVFQESTRRREIEKHLRTMPITRQVEIGYNATTPIDVEASREKGYTVFIKDQAFAKQNPSYFRTDLRLSLKWNRNKRTNTLSLDVQNLTNRQNVYGEWFSKQEGKVVYSYQNGLIPILNYKVEF